MRPWPKALDVRVTMQAQIAGLNPETALSAVKLLCCIRKKTPSSMTELLQAVSMICYRAITWSTGCDPNNAMTNSQEIFRLWRRTVFSCISFQWIVSHFLLVQTMAITWSARCDWLLTVLTLLIFWKAHWLCRGLPALSCSPKLHCNLISLSCRLYQDIFCQNLQWQLETRFNFQTSKFELRFKQSNLKFELIKVVNKGVGLRRNSGLYLYQWVAIFLQLLTIRRSSLQQNQGQKFFLEIVYFKTLLPLTDTRCKYT